jgi:hypothetical protein
MARAPGCASGTSAPARDGDAGIAIDLLFASTSVSQRANIYVIRTETE